MDWLEAFHQAAQNMNTVNSMRNRSLAEQEAQTRQQFEEFQRALDSEDPIAMNNYGIWLCDHGGNRDLGMQYFTKAAMKGQANALASFIWFSLKAEDYEDALILYSACRERLMPTDADQLANIDSNYALCLLASGGDSQKAAELWIHHRDRTDHAECHVFPVVLAHQSGDTEKRDALAAKVPRAMWVEMKELMLEEQMSSKGWFKKWCRTSYQMILELGH